MSIDAPGSSAPADAESTPTAVPQQRSRREAREAERAATEHGRRPSGSRPSRRTALLVTGGVLAAAAAGAGAFVAFGGDEKVAAVVAPPMATLPPSVGGLDPVNDDQDFTKQKVWQDRVTEQVGDKDIIAKQYGTIADRKYIRVVAARTDLTGKLQLAWAADQGKQVGNYRCTDNFVIGTGAKPEVRPTMLICWRTTAAYSAYALSVNFDAKPDQAQAVAALSAVWKDR